MVIYADEDYYKKEYLQGKAAVITAAFPYYSREASQVIKKYVFDNIDDENPPEEVKMCCCEIAELAYKRDQSAQSDRVGASRMKVPRAAEMLLIKLSENAYTIGSAARGFFTGG